MEKKSNQSHIAITFFLLTYSLICSYSALSAENLTFVKAFNQQQQQENFVSLHKRFGHNKKLPLGYELQALIALSHFPELAQVKLEFIIEDVNIPLSSRPHWTSMLRSAKKRTYKIVIDSNLEGPRDVLLLKNQPFNAQIGIIGHELSHTSYYLDRSFFGIAKDAVCQLSQCRVKFERDTDRRLIEHGLGWQRLAHAKFVRSRLAGPTYASNPTAEGGAYMSPEELQRLIDANERYRP